MPDPVALRSSRDVRQVLGVLALLLAAAGSSAIAQPGPSAQESQSIRGVVLDSTGRPIRDADVSILDRGRKTQTDSAGRFAISGLARGEVELSVRRIGYNLRRLPVMVGGADSVRVVMSENVVELAGVETKAMTNQFMKGFNERRAKGVGTFITRADIDARHASVPSDLFRSLPNVRLVRAGAGLGIRFPGVTSLRRGAASECVPMIWLDGQRAQSMEIDDIRMGDINAIELYRGASTTPAQFSTAGATQCGAVVIWTKRRE